MHELVRSQRDWLRELTGSRPAVLQNACNLLWSNLTDKKTVEAADFAEQLRRQTSHYFEQDWSFSTPEEKKAMLLIALSRLEGKVPGREYNLGGLDVLISQMKTSDLKERALLEEIAQGARTVWRFRSTLFEWLVLQQIEGAKDEAELAERQKLLFGLARRDVARISNAMHLMWEKKDTILAAVKWVGGIVGSFGKGVIAPGA